MNKGVKIYLQQFLSQAGVASRRKAVELIRSGQLKVNGVPALAGQKIDPLVDKIELNGKKINYRPDAVYYLVNKPAGYVCTTRDKFAEKIVTSLVPPHPKVWPVGRLDKDSRGLIILTNDGALTQQLTHPSFKHEKEYLVTLNKNVTAELLAKLRSGVKLEEGVARADKLEKLSAKQISLVIHQGWNRQIRRMLGRCGYNVQDLERIRLGMLKLNDVAIGQYRIIGGQALLQIFQAQSVDSARNDLSDKEFQKIQLLYEKRLTLPQERRFQKIIICPIGIIGSGKTTIAKPLSKQLSFLRISSDEVREILKKAGYNYDRAKELTYAIAKKYISLGYNIFIDADCVAPCTKKIIAQMEKEYHLKVFWLHINPPERFILEKLKHLKYQKAGVFRNTAHALTNYYNRKLLHRNIRLPFTYVFDTSRKDLSRQINSAAKIIKEEMKNYV